MVNKLLYANLNKAFSYDVQTLWNLAGGQNLLPKAKLFADQLVSYGDYRRCFELLKDIDLLHEIQSFFKQDALDILVDLVEQFLVY